MILNSFFDFFVRFHCRRYRLLAISLDFFALYYIGCFFYFFGRVIWNSFLALAFSGELPLAIFSFIVVTSASALVFSEAAVRTYKFIYIIWNTYLLFFFISVIVDIRREVEDSGAVRRIAYVFKESINVGGEFLFSYDIFSLILCTLTIFVFLVVYILLFFRPEFAVVKYYYLFSLLETFILLTFSTHNLLAFYVFFELSTIPMAIIIYNWGVGDRSSWAAKMFAIYSVAGSLPMLIAIIFLWNSLETLSYFEILINLHKFSPTELTLMWLAFTLAFFVKIPVVPFHSWLLNAHVEAPTSGSIVLAAILLKIGLFGLVRFSIGLFPDVSGEFKVYVCAMAIFSAIYAALCSITEDDIKKIVAYSSIVHMNTALLGLFLLDKNLSFQISVIMIVSHAFTSTGMFMIVGCLYDRFHTRKMSYYGGLISVMPNFVAIFFIFTLANSGFPCSLGFVAEVSIFIALFKQSLAAAILMSAASIITALVNLNMFIKISFGNIVNPSATKWVNDFTLFELFLLWGLALISFGAMLNSGTIISLLGSL